ncbi:MAG: hypothetical protein DRI86_03725 [Bacteroidetes bacterium]|nr:MAG: hypothetical protein DRI86_03725 [Bacteroidota bacterium]
MEGSNHPMKIKESIFNLASKHQKLLEFLVIFLLFLGISFEFSGSDVTWAWSNYPFIAVLLILLAIILMLLWIKVERKKMDVFKLSLKENSNTDDKRELLSRRQQQVYDLIIANKSNKEICEELFIEMSTLKTHINNLYKILEVKNRKELKKEHKNQ